MGHSWKNKNSQQVLVGFSAIIKILFFLMILFVNACSEDTNPNDNYDSPKALTVTKFSNGKVQLTWTYSTQSSNIIYIVARKEGAEQWNESYYTSSDDAKSYIDDIPTNSYTVYSYKVKAKEVETQKESYFSDPASYFPDITVPTDMQVVQQGQNQLKITWSDNVIGEAGYKIDKKINQGNWVTAYASLGEDTEEYVDEIDQLYQTISYRVYAFVGSTTSPKCETTFTPTIQIPSDVTCTQITQSQIKISWGYGIESPNFFDIQRKIGINEWTDLQRVSGSYRHYIDNLLIESGTVGYRVRSVKDTLYSAFSSLSSINFNIDSLSALTLTNPGNQIFYKDNYIFLANDYNGTMIIDVSNPTAPEMVSMLTMPGKTMSVCVDNNKLYMTNNEGLLQIYNITDMSSPVLINSVSILGQGYDISIKSINGHKYAFIAGGTAGLLIVALEDPTIPEPYVLSRYNTSGTTFNIDFDGNTVYLADGANGVIKLNMDNPASPALITHNSSVGAVNDIVLANQFIYIANGDQGISILNRNDLSVVSQYDTQGYSNAIALDNRNIYIADRDNGFLIATIVNPEYPYSICHIPFSSYVNTVTIHNKYAYLATDDQLIIIQIRP